MVLFVGEGSEREQCHLLSSQLAQLLLPLPTIKLGPSGADSQECGLVYVLGPCGSLQWTLLWGLEFLPLLQPPQDFRVRGFEAFFPSAGTLGYSVSCSPVFPPTLSACKCGTSQSSSCHFAVCPLTPAMHFCPSYQYQWIIFSLTPWLSDFHTIWFSGSSGCFLFLCLLLSFLCARRQSVSTYASILAGSLQLPDIVTPKCFSMNILIKISSYINTEPLLHLRNLAKIP